MKARQRKARKGTTLRLFYTECFSNIWLSKVSYRRVNKLNKVKSRIGELISANS